MKTLLAEKSICGKEKEVVQPAIELSHFIFNRTHCKYNSCFKLVLFFLKRQ